jgi:hypothetical protein
MFEHPALGRFAWNGEFEYWEGKVELDGNVCDLTLRDWGSQPVAATAERAVLFLGDWSSWRERVQQAIIDDLFTLYNETWRDADQPPLKLDEFFLRLRLNAIQFTDDNWCSLSFYQSDLFTDHGVDVSVSPDGKVKATLEG